MTAGVALEVAGAHLGARKGPVPREASARRAHSMRPPQPGDPRTLARVRPLGGPPTYRAQANPEGLRDTARSGQSAARSAMARGGPSVQEHFFGRQDTRLPLPDPSAGCPTQDRAVPGLAAGSGRPGLALPGSHSQLAEAGRTAATCPQREGVKPEEPSVCPALSAPLLTHRLPGLPHGLYRNMAIS